MKAHLTFNLDDHDDSMAHMRCVKALDMALAMWTFSNRFKTICDESEDGKYIDEALIRNAWQETLDEYNLNFDQLIQ